MVGLLVDRYEPIVSARWAHAHRGFNGASAHTPHPGRVRRVRRCTDQGVRRRRRIRRRATLLRTDSEGGDSMNALSTIKWTEIAHRTSDGIDVMLVWVHGGGADEALVSVYDTREGTYFEIPTEPRHALDVYYHPFA